ncbi:hypothetical protein ElyMa_004414600 [Elysia marginata]|uniref:Uncharacterized protein n=1 Tax=Elysia marginata TaxID=1093978 RepID=A0AAV4H9B1_9GAST|nr:hypothetical protein ElyMa_004414600 [Elysia marginata]
MGGRTERITIDRLIPRNWTPPNWSSCNNQRCRGHPLPLRWTTLEDNLRLRLKTDSSCHAWGETCDCRCASSNSVRCLCWGEVCGALSNQIVPFRHCFYYTTPRITVYFLPT